MIRGNIFVPSQKVRPHGLCFLYYSVGFSFVVVGGSKTIPPPKKRTFHVERSTLFGVDIPYRPNLISSTFISAGDTPGIREAWPIVFGRIFVSFCRASIVSDCMLV